MSGFYERTEVIHEVVEARRSEICYGLIKEKLLRNSGERKRILDIGCGDGSFSSRFERYCNVFGVDVSQRSVDLARKAGLDARVVDISYEKLPFSNSYFDLVYMGDVIEHLLNPDFAILEVLRVTKSNGYLILSTPNLASWLNRLLLLVGVQPMFSEVSAVKNFSRAGKQDTVAVGHLRIFTYGSLRKFLAHYGFSIVKAKGAYYDDLPNPLRAVDSLLSNIPSVASTIVVEARKSCFSLSSSLVLAANSFSEMLFTG